MAINQLGDGSVDGVQAPNTKFGFYGAAPVAQRAATSIHYTSVVSSYTATTASALIGAWIVEVTNTLVGLGLWV